MIYADGKELYAIFLLSDFWIELSRQKRRQVRKCEKCGCDSRLQAHHVRYPENWFDTRLADLKVLCRPCHEKEHGIVESPFLEMELDDSKIPESAFILPDKNEFKSFHELIEARRNGRISRGEYLMWKHRIGDPRKRRKKKRNNQKKTNRKPTKVYYPQSGIIVINHYYGSHKPYRHKWVNRGTSSN